ncbi:MAG: hypothetical protein IJ038_05625 [Clostridia bacterium]|nr:hypothetical protein [Clostridia bacterium]
MSWEVISEVIALPAAYVTAFAAIINIIIKVNRTLCSLEIAVKQLKECIEKQSDKNSDFYSSISDHEVRISNIEYKIESLSERQDKE